MLNIHGIAFWLAQFLTFPYQTLSIVKSNSRNKSRSFKIKVDPKFSISDINISSLHSNYPNGELHLNFPVCNWFQSIYSSSGIHNPWLLTANYETIPYNTRMGSYVAETPKTKTLIFHSCAFVMPSFIIYLSSLPSIILRAMEL